MLHAWQISHQTSRCHYHEGRQPRASIHCNPSLSAASRSSWVPRATLTINLYVKIVLTAPQECSTCPYQRSFLSYRMRSRSSMPSRASTCSSLDLIVGVSCGLHGRSVLSLLCPFAADAGGLALLIAKFRWHEALQAHTSAVHMPTCLERELVEERTGSSSLNFF